MSEQLGTEDQDILQAALTTAFSAAAVTQASSVTELPKPNLPPAQESAPVASTSPEASSSISDSWKAEYEENVKTWRAQSAEAREKAERERERWEKIRQEEALAQKTHGAPTPSESGWETLGENSTTLESDSPSQDINASSSPNPSPADVRDLVTGEPQGRIHHTSHDENEAGEEQKWEDIPSSITSSFPSMSFPEGNNTPPSNPPHDPPTLSATTAIFDSSLSKKTRLSALLSSLAINMLLPFINGVMLGFGEIFAKNVILDWFGWKSGGVAANVGIRSGRLKERQRWTQN